MSFTIVNLLINNTFLFESNDFGLYILFAFMRFVSNM